MPVPGLGADPRHFALVVADQLKKTPAIDDDLIQMEGKTELARVDLALVLPVVVIDKMESDAQLLHIGIAGHFSSEISQKNIHSNYLEVARIVSRADFTEVHIDFFLNKCQVVAVALNDVSEAFQFFDSQNARGRDLEPHDLLKAYHLREFGPHDEPLKAATVARWENSDSKELATLFSQYLYRIRNWSKGISARYFSKDDSDLFKGVNIDTVASYPFGFLPGKH